MVIGPLGTTNPQYWETPRDITVGSCGGQTGHLEKGHLALQGEPWEGVLIRAVDTTSAYRKEGGRQAATTKVPSQACPEAPVLGTQALLRKF